MYEASLPLSDEISHTLRFAKPQLIPEFKRVYPEAAGETPVWHVRFESPRKIPIPDGNLAYYNDAFPLRFYLPKKKASRLFIFVNGFSEGVVTVWDRLGSTLAREGFASVLLPLPQHFARSLIFNAEEQSQQDEYVVRSSDLRKIYNQFLQYGFRAHPRLLVGYNRQMMLDIETLASTVTTRVVRLGNHPLNDFLNRHFAEQVQCSILGFSLGGLFTLQAFLNSPELFNSCVLINSGASLQDMNASQVFSKEHWLELQRKVVAVTSELSPSQMAPNFQRVFLGHEKVALHDQLTKYNKKFLLILGGSDPIFNRDNTRYLQPEATGLAVFQIPSLEHFINIGNRGGQVWDEWSAFTAKMILAFDQFRPA